MLLKRIKLRNFRNFCEKEVNFNPLLTIIIGPNSRGKTNLLEAIYFIINGVGFREKREDELILLSENQAYVEGVFEVNSSELTFQINLHKKNETVEKSFFIDKTRKNHKDYLKEQTLAVLFSPEQINIITGSPDSRRTYINKLICYYDYEYKKRLVNYEAALRKRNKILEFFKNIDELKEELVFWNSYLEEQANYITKKREEYVDYLNKNKKIAGKEFEIEYQKNIFNKKRLTEVFELEKKWRQTFIGPQKDDFRILLHTNLVKKNIQLYGSRSEQRLGIFWLKMNEVRYYEDRYKKKPIILLDDIFSEFDEVNKKLIFDTVRRYQTVLTATEVDIPELKTAQKTVVNL